MTGIIWKKDNIPAASGTTLPFSVSAGKIVNPISLGLARTEANNALQ